MDKIDGKFVPHCPPNQGWENGAFWLLREFIFDLGGGEDGGLLFHFILSKIVAITVLEMLLMILKNITVIGVFVLGYVFQNE